MRASRVRAHVLALLCSALPSLGLATQAEDAAFFTYPQRRRVRAASLIKSWIARGNRYHHNGDIYEFGVFTGGGLRAWPEQFGGNLTFRHQWGFDSFSGMPSLDQGESVAEGASFAKFVAADTDTGPGALSAGQLDMRKHFRTSSWQAIETSLLRCVTCTGIYVVCGDWPVAAACPRHKVRCAHLVRLWLAGSSNTSRQLSSMDILTKAFPRCSRPRCRRCGPRSCSTLTATCTYRRGSRTIGCSKTT